MIDVSAAFQTAIAEDTVKLAELFILQVADGTIYRYTTHQQDIVWDEADNVYTAAVPIQRKAIGYRHTGEFDEVEVALGNIAGTLFDEVHLNVLENALLTIKRIRWDQSWAEDEEYVLFIGTIDIRFNRKVLSFSCRPYIDSLNIQVPRHKFQEPCNHSLYDINCGLSQDAYAYAGTATGGSRTTVIDTTMGTTSGVLFETGDEALPIEIGDAITGQDGGGTAVVVNIVYLTETTGTMWYVELVGAQLVIGEEVQNGDGDSIVVSYGPSNSGSLYEQGEMRMTSGNNSGSRRPILSTAAGTFIVMWPFVRAIEAGDTFNVYPGCDQRTTICFNRFDNADNFRGFPYIPKFEDAMT